MKPECEVCRSSGKEGFSEIFGKDVAEKLAYGIFNPNSLEGESEKNFNLEEFIKSHMEQGFSDTFYEYVSRMLGRGEEEGWTYESWIDEQAKTERAKEKAWLELISKIKSKEVDSSEVPLDEMLKTFMKKVLEGLAEDGLVDVKSLKNPDPLDVSSNPMFTSLGEKVVAKKILDEAFYNLRKLAIGPHEIEEEGFGVSPSSTIREYDDFKDSYDHIDIQESILRTALRDPEEMGISEQDLRTRVSHHTAKSANVILMDISNSMYGAKFRGGVMATLALQQLFDEEFKDDVLHIVAYNEEPLLVLPRQVLRLRPSGFTDIGRALDLSTEILSREEGNRNVFLITDSEPTASHRRDHSPLESAFRAAWMAGKHDIHLNILMLDRKPILMSICEKIAKLNGNASIACVENPLNLKECVIKSYIDHKLTRGKR